MSLSLDHLWAFTTLRNVSRAQRLCQFSVCLHKDILWEPRIGSIIGFRLLSLEGEAKVVSLSDLPTGMRPHAKDSHYWPQPFLQQCPWRKFKDISEGIPLRALSWRDCLSLSRPYLISDELISWSRPYTKGGQRMEFSIETNTLIFKYHTDWITNAQNTKERQTGDFLQLGKQLLCGAYKCIDMSLIVTMNTIRFNVSFEKPSAKHATKGHVCVKPPFFFVASTQNHKGSSLL
ncbi:Hypothetical predicted protein [Marmota monax]|uniref:Uncharacterized protein n=1 Tax=Marmota monax TaxID=9995 RepID=A0A5E4AX62_MARMO|nr:Hypothetical predicted protein [Marmota monax]